MIGSLASVRSVFADAEHVANGLKKFTLRLVSPATERIGWNFATNEDFLTGQLRALVITVAGGAGHQRLETADHFSVAVY